MEEKGCAGGDIPSQIVILSGSRILFFLGAGDVVECISSMIFMLGGDIALPVLMVGIVAPEMENEIEILESESEIRNRVFISLRFYHLLNIDSL
jgi:hypothetical protein